MFWQNIGFRFYILYQPKYSPIYEHLTNNYDLEFVLNGTSSEYDLKSGYNANSYLGTISPLQQIFWAIYDTGIFPFSYTGSEHIDITDNQISKKSH